MADTRIADAPQPAPLSWQSLAESGRLARALDRENATAPHLRKLRLTLEPKAEPHTLRLKMPCDCGSCIVKAQLKAGASCLVLVWNEEKQKCSLRLEELADAAPSEGLPEPVAGVAAGEAGTQAAASTATAEAVGGAGGGDGAGGAGGGGGDGSEGEGGDEEAGGGGDGGGSSGEAALPGSSAACPMELDSDDEPPEPAAGTEPAAPAVESEQSPPLMAPAAAAAGAEEPAPLEEGAAAADAAAVEALVAEVAEGLRLHLSSSSTGYKGVYKHHARFMARHRVGGRLVSIGYFDTAVEAAVAYARAVGEAPEAGSAVAAGGQASAAPLGEAAEGAAAAEPSVEEAVTAAAAGTEQPAPLEEGAAAAAAAAEAPLAEEAEGLRLHLSSSSSTGYKGVYKGDSRNGRFEAKHRVAGRQVTVGRFDTAVEAAVAFARAVGEYQPPAPPTVGTEAEGLRLHLSSSNPSGYKGVVKHASGRFEARHKVDGRQVYLAVLDTAVEAAVAYARAVGEAPEAGSAVAAAAGQASAAPLGEAAEGAAAAEPVVEEEAVGAESAGPVLRGKRSLAQAGMDNGAASSESKKSRAGVECGAGGDGGDTGGDGGGPGVGPGGRRHCLVCRRVGRRHCSIHREAPDPLARPATAAAVTPGLRQERQQGLRGRPPAAAPPPLRVNQHTAQEVAPLELACTGCKAAHRTIHNCRVRLERSPAMCRLDTL